MGLLQQIAEIYFFTFLVIFIRVTTFYLAAPIFGGAGVPAHLKIGLGLLTSLILVFTMEPGIFPMPRNNVELVLLILIEVGVGLLLGYAVALMFAGLQLAGQLMGYQMGFAVANVLDPTSQERVSIVGQFIFIFGVLYFLILDGHHMIIRAMVESFNMAPPMGVGITGNTVTIVIRLFTNMFVLGLQIALPIIGTLFLIDVSLGIIAKTVPQMNVFIVGLPLKSLVGLTMLTITFGLIAFFMRVEIGRLTLNLGWLLRSMFTGG
jgi:flagellar biosynthetic protein FliR